MQSPAQGGSGWCIVATGPSAATAGTSLDRVDPARVIVVNDAFRLQPGAGHLYACDPEWWKVHHQAVASTFRGRCWTQSAVAAAAYKLDRVVGSQHEGLCLEPGRIYFNHNSGAQAVNLAYHLGARTIVLVGFDMGPIKGQEHFFGDHPPALKKGSPYSKFVRAFGALGRDARASGLRIINTSPVDRLPMFPRLSLPEALHAAGL